MARLTAEVNYLRKRLEDAGPGRTRRCHDHARQVLARFPVNLLRSPKVPWGRKGTLARSVRPSKRCSPPRRDLLSLVACCEESRGFPNDCTDPWPGGCAGGWGVGIPEESVDDAERALAPCHEPFCFQFRPETGTEPIVRDQAGGASVEQTGSYNPVATVSCQLARASQEATLCSS